MTSKMCIVLCRSSVPILIPPQQSSQNYCIFRVAKNTTPISLGARPYLLAPGCICPLSHLPSVTADELPKVGLLCSYATDITYKTKFSFFYLLLLFSSLFLYLHAVCKLTCPNDFRDKQKVVKLMVRARAPYCLLYTSDAADE